AHGYDHDPRPEMGARLLVGFRTRHHRRHGAHHSGDRIAVRLRGPFLAAPWLVVARVFRRDQPGLRPVDGLSNRRRQRPVRWPPEVDSTMTSVQEELALLAIS